MQLHGRRPVGHLGREVARVVGEHDEGQRAQGEEGRLGGRGLHLVVDAPLQEGQVGHPDPLGEALNRGLEPTSMKPPPPLRPS